MKTKELLDCHEEFIDKEQEILEWSLKYLQERKEREPPMKKKRLDEQEILEWSANYLRERNRK